MSKPRLPVTLTHDPVLQRVMALLNADGETAMLVGGVVRNGLMNRPQTDIDIATTALPATVMERARQAGIKAHPTGIDHGTVTLVLEGRPFEVTTLREDIDTDGRRATVLFGRDFSHDARRRDFTMNALYAEANGTIHDFVGGLADIAARRVRFIGDPTRRIREDYLRILRFFRFHADYADGPLDREGLLACEREREGIETLSRERVRAEFMKLLMARRVIDTLRGMDDVDLLAPVLSASPDIDTLFCLLALKTDADPLLRLFALAGPDEKTVGLLRERFRLSNTESSQLVALARASAALSTVLLKLTRADVRRLAYRFGVDAIRDALFVGMAKHGMQRMPGPLAERVAEAATAPESSPFGGAELLARGLVPGPHIGKIVARAEALWMSADFPTSEKEHAAILDKAIAETSGN